MVVRSIASALCVKIGKDYEKEGKFLETLEHFAPS